MKSNIKMVVYLGMIALVIFTACAPEGETPGSLDCTLEMDESYPVGEPVNLSFKLHNPTDRTLYVLTWYTPLEGMAGEIFQITRDGEELPVESVGEIAVRGPGVMLGYHRQPGETAEAFDSQGFLLTGDLGIVDEDGFVHLVGRRKEVIIRAGFNVYPREVESRLEAHPAVREAAVVGVSDPLLGEASCACIVPVEGAIVTSDEILDWCRETLADPKIPDQVRFLDAFPRTGTGKIRRIELSRLVQSGGRSA